jgi:hypothetical protein
MADQTGRPHAGRTKIAFLAVGQGLLVRLAGSVHIRRIPDGFVARVAVDKIRIAVADQAHEVPVAVSPLLLLSLVSRAVKMAPQLLARAESHLTDETAVVGSAASQVGQQLMLWTRDGGGGELTLYEVSL